MSRALEVVRSFGRGFARGFVEGGERPVPRVRRARRREECEVIVIGDVQTSARTEELAPEDSAETGRYVGKGRCPECFTLDAPLFRHGDGEPICRTCILEKNENADG